MTILNFTCLEKKSALINHACCQTIRTSVEKFYTKKGLRMLRYFGVDGPGAFYSSPPDTSDLLLHPLHIWWNARNFHIDTLGPKQFLGMGEITSIERKRIRDITEEDAVADGFGYEENTAYLLPKYDEIERLAIIGARGKCIVWLLSHNKGLTLDDFIFIITWRWKQAKSL